MKNTHTGFKPNHVAGVFAAACVATLLSACGGGSDTAPSPQQAPAQMAAATSTLQLAVSNLPDAVAAQSALPSFHIAPVLLNAPDDIDAAGNSASARMGARMQAAPAEFNQLSTRGLTRQVMESVRRVRALGAQAPSADGTATPMATGSVVATYSPAQIRAAYGLPALPVAGAALTAPQAAQLGAGQTIYLVDAMHDPNVAAELAAFNQKFGLPLCTTKTIASSESLPLTTASSGGCEFSLVYSTANATMTGTAPAYDSGWSTEITLDVQWAHATAPLARIVLIEAPDATLNSLLSAVKLANAMGPGVVSMSFGSAEGNWTASVDSAFAGANMTYLAATGDSGAAVQWPAVSSNVVAVGGTTLTYSGAGTRSEVSWSGTGGGTSLYTPTPSYQTSAVPGMGTVAHRTVADVAFNADPTTGQYVAVIAPGSTTVGWVSAGGTSLSTPQWAGLIAVANAARAQAAKPALGAPHAVLYGQIATVPGGYASAFADITKGSDGSCATCSAKVGYDPLTGLGTPNAASLLSALSGSTSAATPPLVTSASISGKVGTALSFTVSITAANAVTYSLSGAPVGMSISGAGVVSWASPVLGSYSVTVTAKDSKTGLSGQGVYTVKIATAGPVITAAAITGVAGKPLTGTISISDPGVSALSASISGAPLGMGFSVSGMTITASWPSPVTGSYSLKVSVSDSSGLSAQVNVPITVSAK